MLSKLFYTALGMLALLGLIFHLVFRLLPKNLQRKLGRRGSAAHTKTSKLVEPNARSVLNVSEKR